MRVRFSLRFMLVLVFVVATPCAVFTGWWRSVAEQRKAVNCIYVVGGKAFLRRNNETYEWADPFGPSEACSFERWLPKGAIDRVTAVHLDEVPAASNLQEWEKINDALRVLRHCEELTISDEDFTDLHLATLDILPRIKALRIRKARISVDGWSQLQRCESLEFLAIEESCIVGKGLAGLRQTPIQCLGVGTCECDEQTIEAIAEIKGLRVLQIQSCRLNDQLCTPLMHSHQLEVLDLSDNPVGDDGLAFVETLSRLRDLRLDATNANDSIVALVRHLQSLESVSIRDSRLTEQGRNRLMAMQRFDCYTD